MDPRARTDAQHRPAAAPAEDDVPVAGWATRSPDARPVLRTWTAREPDPVGDRSVDGTDLLESRKDALLAEAAKETDDPALAALLPVYYRYVPPDELVDRSTTDLLTAVASHRDLAAERVPGQLRLTVHTPPAGAGWCGGHSVVEIVTDDMPFLVDSVTAELARHEYGLHLLVHPQLVVRREVLGTLVGVRTDVDPDGAADGEIVESWMHIEVDRQTDPDVVAELRNDLQRVLTDVRDAVEDWERMRARALGIADELAQAEPPVPDKDVTDARELLRWLADDHFTFLGYREYSLVGDGDERRLEALLGTGLGILRGDSSRSRSLADMGPDVSAKLLERRLLIITKANSRSTVHRPAYLDYIGLKTFDAAGRVVGERRFLGLFSSAAYLDSVRKLPVVSRKVDDVLARSGLSPRSHSGKDLVQILETYPRDELFQISTSDLLATAMAVLRLGGRRQLRLFVRRDAYGRFTSCLVYLPRDRYTTRNRLKMQDILMEALHGVGVDYTTRVTESVLARVKFVVRTDPATTLGPLDVDALQARLADATRSWDDDLATEIRQEIGEEQATVLLRRYGAAFPEAYKAEHPALDAVGDLSRIEMLEHPGDLGMRLYRDPDSGVRFTVYRSGDPMALSEVLPVLHALGVSVVDERPYRIDRADAVPTWVYDFGLRAPAHLESGEVDVAQVHATVENAFAACWRGECEVDGFNALVLGAGLAWHQVVVLRAYAKYLRQVGTIYSQAYIERALTAHPDVARQLVDLFCLRFDPRGGEDAPTRAAALDVEITAALDAVASLDEDRILRGFQTLIRATLRTNHFQRGEGGRHKAYLSLKIDSRSVPDLPRPRPAFEIFVYSPRVEGVHLRFGPVARGGLRWSDRREDFRTEVLGLVKAQMVKNVVIVPVGSKGGFVTKRSVGGDREAVLAEGVACYRMFISGLLDLTDNLVGGAVVPPPDVVRHDGDDPYLVVAADKGTATFSDIANDVAASYGYWLGDAFASGGSVGYDHKAMGITARGAWESVKKHFRELVRGSDEQSRELVRGSGEQSRELVRGGDEQSRELVRGSGEQSRELGLDTQTEDFTVVGIGDMSGDVFGNGMLLSEHIRLVAAFDHRHVFLDPDPDAPTGFRERRRLFDLPRSSWADYDPALISAGGGVWPRTAKAIPVSPEARAALGLADTVTALSPAELIRAVLTAPVDLLWNGGIGTYVKASDESSLDVGDKSNDAVRVDGRDLRAKVVGEGGNLGLTQRGRIEFALAGGRVNTDAIDNSAGVDTSDHEVNIKILLAAAIEAGELDAPERAPLLAAMTDEVAELVLVDDYDQNAALGLSRFLAPRLVSVHRRLLTELERAGRLDRGLEFLPDDDALAARAAARRGLTSPELSVLMAYVKIGLAEDLLPSALPDDPWCARVMVDYFPAPLRERFRARMDAHPLRREIVTTAVVNEMVNHCGVTFAFRAVEETGAEVVDVVRAYVVVREVFGLRRLWADTKALDNLAPPAAQTAALAEIRRVVDRGVRWLLQSRSGSIDVLAEIDRLRPGTAELLDDLPNLFVGREQSALRAHVGALTDAGVPAELSGRITAVLYGFGLLDVVELARETDRPHREVAQVYYQVSERFQVDELLDRISALPRDDRWQSLARMALRYDLYAALAGLTREVLQSVPTDLPAEERVSRWSEVNAGSISRTLNTLAQLGEDTPGDLATLSVVLRQIRTVVRASETSPA